MPRIKTVTISVEQKAALENAVKYGSTPSYRKRCQAILLKGGKRTSLAIAKELSCCEMSVNDWMKRFDEQGIDGLRVANPKMPKRCAVPFKIMHSGLILLKPNWSRS